MKYAVDLGERQYAVLCGDAVLLSANGRHEVWFAMLVSGAWRLRASEPEAAEMREVFRIRGMADGMASIDTALAAPHKRGARPMRPE